MFYGCDMVFLLLPISADCFENLTLIVRWFHLNFLFNRITVTTHDNALKAQLATILYK